ncbi:MAG: hypothetical protein HQ538_04505 [Parcubacteria group bacterium]|nr:hypothetical protein [Parcubacteria group bacterium]
MIIASELIRRYQEQIIIKNKEIQIFNEAIDAIEYFLKTKDRSKFKEWNTKWKNSPLLSGSGL